MTLNTTCSIQLYHIIYIAYLYTTHAWSGLKALKRKNLVSESGSLFLTIDHHHDTNGISILLVCSLIHGVFMVYPWCIHGVYVCIYICIYIYICVYVCIYIYMCICMYVYLYMCIYVYMYYVYIYIPQFAGIINYMKLGKRLGKFCFLSRKKLSRKSHQIRPYTVMSSFKVQSIAHLSENVVHPQVLP